MGANGFPSNASNLSDHGKQSNPNATLDNDVEVVDVVSRPIFPLANADESSFNENANTSMNNNARHNQNMPLPAQLPEFQPVAPMAAATPPTAPMAPMAPITRNHRNPQYRYEPPSYSQNHRVNNHKVEQSGPPQWSLPLMPNRLDERIYFERQPGYIPSWGNFLQPPRPGMGTGALSESPKGPRAYVLSLLSQNTFTVTAVPTCDGLGNYIESNLNGMRIHIKKITKNYGNGQKAVFEKFMNSEGKEEGRWRIPISAYYAFSTYLRSDNTTYVQEIPEYQLKIASLAREVSDRGHPSPEELVTLGVPHALANTLAPYQRGGVGFALMKDGRVLIADDMGLGKSVQSIAAMVCYRDEWPLLILTPSSARYHWRNELVQWLGNQQLAKDDNTDDSENEENAEQDVNPLGRMMQQKLNKKRRADKDIKKKQSKIARQNSKENLDGREPLTNYHINVITKGKDTMFPRKDTCVVVCSYGLATTLIEDKKIMPGLFRCVIVDESHMLKNNKSKRTLAIVPLLKAASRVIMLSGTPAFSKPYELYPQINALLDHMWLPEEEYIKRYCQGREDVEVKGDDANISDPNLAELHAMLTSTVMIRRTKQEVLKNLPGKVRESAQITIRDLKLKNENVEMMCALRRCRGLLGRLSRQHHSTRQLEIDNTSPDPYLNPSSESLVGGDATVVGSEDVPIIENPDTSRKAILGSAFKLSGISKIPVIIDMVDRFLNDTTSGKLCIFAHHTDVISSIVAHVEHEGHKFMSITGSTLPRTRQDHIYQFQTDPLVRIAILGITAAGVGVTLTAASTVWFAELFWTPAVLIQAEDRCHRIGQQAKVHCLYLIAKGTLDEILWLLVKKKFRDLGEFVEGKEKLDIVVHRHYPDEWSAVSRICSGSENEDISVGEVDLEKLDNTMEEMASEEQASGKTQADDDDDDDDDVEASSENLGNSGQLAACGSVTREGTERSTTGAKSECPQNTVICLSDDEVECLPVEKAPTEISDIVKMHNDKPDETLIRNGFSPSVRFPSMQFYTVPFNDKSYGLALANFSGRVIVQRSPNGIDVSAGSIIAAVNNQIVPHNIQFKQLMDTLKSAIKTPPVVLTFAEDKVFEKFWMDVLKPGLRNYSEKLKMQKAEKEKAALMSANKNMNQAQSVNGTNVIDLLDDE